jgi:uncharacterized paraquat-inducible protein A
MLRQGGNAVIVERMGGTMIDSDRLLARLRERVSENAADYNHGHCDNCHTDLTAADAEAGECSNCHSAIESDDEELCDGHD